MTRMKLLAIDLGASSGRVMQAIYDGQTLQLTEVHRFANEPVSLMMACTGIFYTYKMKSNAALRRRRKLMTFLFVLFQWILGVSTMPIWIKREI